MSDRPQGDSIDRISALQNEVDSLRSSLNAAQAEARRLSDLRREAADQSESEHARWMSADARATKAERRLADVRRLAFEQAAQIVESWANNYPDDVFDPNGTTSDAISARALRLVLPRVAEKIRDAITEPAWSGGGNTK